MKRDFFPSLPHLPSLPSLGSITNLTREFKHLVPERNGSIRRSVRTRIGSFKNLGKQKATTVSGFVIGDRYLNHKTWAQLSSLDVRTLKKKLKSENKVFEKCPRQIRENYAVQGSWTDLRSLGLFLRPYKPFLQKEQFTIRINFRTSTYSLSHELYEGQVHVVLCDVHEVRDVTNVLGEELAVPRLTLCAHDSCALSALHYAVCPGADLCLCIFVRV
jgi:hypothetical protein